LDNKLTQRFRATKVDRRASSAVTGGSQPLSSYAADVTIILLITACCIAIQLYLPASQPALVWLMFAPALGLIVGLVPAMIIRRAYRRSRSRESAQSEIVALLLKDYAAERGDWLWRTDANDCLVNVGEKFAAHAGERAEDLENRRLVDLLRSRVNDRGTAFAEIDVAIRQRQSFYNVELCVRGKNKDLWWRVAGKPVFEKGRFSGYIGTVSDISAEVEARETMHRLAYRDGLTDLGNRSSFTRSLEECVARLERYGTPFTLLYLDLDKFKAVNDGFGHAFGDRLLAEVAKRLKAILRDSDIIARIGGDEFVVLVPNDVGKDEIGLLATRLIAAVKRPYEIETETFVIGMSAGIAMAPINGTRPDQIVRNADLALYRAKTEGGNRHCFFESRMDSDIRERRMLELEIADAIEQDEFVLHYQPLVSASTLTVIGFEALIRWNHPIRGLLSPGEFIPLAERSALIGQIGEWTLHEACRELARLPHHLKIAVNLSTKHFELADMISVVRSALDATGIDPSRLELEITESLLMSNAEEMAATLHGLKTLGVRIAMDDFGTGYSSLSYLMKFPFDRIKIDRSFVTALAQEKAAQEILKTIVGLASTLHMSVTAEGVETEEQSEFLCATGCDTLQGYYFAKPLPVQELLGRLGITPVDLAA
jgi:diguanylate cyclase (GGDEF)-like protein